MEEGEEQKKSDSPPEGGMPDEEPMEKPSEEKAPPMTVMPKTPEAAAQMFGAGIGEAVKSFADGFGSPKATLKLEINDGGRRKLEITRGVRKDENWEKETDILVAKGEDVAERWNVGKNAVKVTGRKK